MTTPLDSWIDDDARAWMRALAPKTSASPAVTPSAGVPVDEEMLFDSGSETAVTAAPKILREEQPDGAALESMRRRLAEIRRRADASGLLKAGPAKLENVVPLPVESREAARAVTPEAREPEMAPEPEQETMAGQALASEPEIGVDGAGWDAGEAAAPDDDEVDLLAPAELSDGEVAAAEVIVVEEKSADADTRGFALPDGPPEGVSEESCLETAEGFAAAVPVVATDEISEPLPEVPVVAPAVAAAREQSRHAGDIAMADSGEEFGGRHVPGPMEVPDGPLAMRLEACRRWLDSECGLGQPVVFDRHGCPLHAADGLGSFIAAAVSLGIAWREACALTDQPGMVRAVHSGWGGGTMTVIPVPTRFGDLFVAGIVRRAVDPELAATIGAALRRAAGV